MASSRTYYLGNQYIRFTKDSPRSCLASIGCFIVQDYKARALVFGGICQIWFSRSFVKVYVAGCSSHPDCERLVLRQNLQSGCCQEKTERESWIQCWEFLVLRYWLYERNKKMGRREAQALIDSLGTVQSMTLSNKLQVGFLLSFQCK